MHWAFLAMAIVSEVFGTSMLKLSNGFTKLYPTVGMAIGFGLAFYFMSLSLRTLPLGIVYAIWAGCGLVLTALIGVFVFGEKTDMAGIVGIGFILVGVLILKTMSQMGAH